MSDARSQAVDLSRESMTAVLLEADREKHRQVLRAHGPGIAVDDRVGLYEILQDGNASELDNELCHHADRVRFASHRSEFRWKPGDIVLVQEGCRIPRFSRPLTASESEAVGGVTINAALRLRNLKMPAAAAAGLV